MRKRKVFPLLENIEIIDAGAEGKAVAKVDELVVFVPFCVPGDVVDIQVISKKKSFAEGKVVKYHTYSPLRVEPFCEHFGTCGGCKWQSLSYDKQLSYKQKQVIDNFTRIGKLDCNNLSPILGSPQTMYYRNKLEYTFSDKRWLTIEEMENEPKEGRQMNALGFHIPQLFDRVLDIKNCYLQPDPSNNIRLAIKNFTIKKSWSYYNARTHEGFLRNIVIRNTQDGQWMIIMVFAYKEDEKIKEMMDFIASEFPEITSLMYVINEKHNDTLADQEVLLWKGVPYLTETMQAPHTGGKPLTFRVGPISFYQTNPLQAYFLYKTAFDLAGFTGKEIVYDLYCGTGTITNFVAPYVKKAVGVEYVPSAIEDAKINAQLNGLTNTVFYAGDLAKVLTPDFVVQNDSPDIIITDPPRSGMHPNVIAQILEIAPRKVVYVSCNPATQARDLSMMAEKYDIKAIQPVDMFPHTHHVENVVLLELKTE